MSYSLGKDTPHLAASISIAAIGSRGTCFLASSRRWRIEAPNMPNKNVPIRATTNSAQPRQAGGCLATTMRRGFGLLRRLAHGTAPYVEMAIQLA